MTDQMLLVEDQESVAESVRVILTEWKIDWAEDGNTALALWAAKKYAIVIADLVLPGELQGMDLIRLMKRREPQTSEFIIITAYPEGDSIRESIMLEVGDYIIKPFSATYLRHSVGMAKIRVNIREGKLGLQTVKRDVARLGHRMNGIEKANEEHERRERK